MANTRRRIQCHGEIWKGIVVHITIYWESVEACSLELVPQCRSVLLWSGHEPCSNAAVNNVLFIQLNIYWNVFEVHRWVRKPQSVI
jgi:hypothetical protein